MPPRKHKYGELTNAIIANATNPDPMPWNAFAEKHQINADSVYTRIKRLRKQGRIAPNTGRNVKSSLDGVVPTTKGGQMTKRGGQSGDLAGLFDILDHTSALDPVTRRRILAVIATQSTDTNKISAIGKLEELDRQAGGRIGPPPPETDEQYAERLGRMLLAAGPRLTQLAIDWASGEANAISARSMDSHGHGDDDSGGRGPESGESAPIPGPEEGPTDGDPLFAIAVPS